MSTILNLTYRCRSQMHASTWRNGKWVKDAPHITVCSKNPLQAQQKSHEAHHGYTKSLKDAQLVKIVPSRVTKPDNTKDKQENEIWPRGLPSEIIIHQGK